MGYAKITLTASGEQPHYFVIVFVKWLKVVSTPMNNCAAVVKQHSTMN
jgi:hypothetical protein